MQNFKESIQLISRSLRRFISLSFILASMIFMVRLYDLIFISGFSHFQPGIIILFLKGLKFDLILYLRISGSLMIPFLIIAFFSQKMAKTFFVVVSVILILAEMLFLQYFSVARVPLGADLFGYSIYEISHTLKVSGKLNVIPYILMALYLALMVRVFIKHVYYQVKPWAITVFTVFMLGSLIFINKVNPNPTEFSDEYSMFVSANKLDFFVQSMGEHFFNTGRINKQSYVFKGTNKTAGENSFTYVDADYPFLHQETTPNILGEYFSFGETPPNIVYILVESLGRAYSGENAYLGSYTPFLDSLMKKSLYWENCLSTSGRTFQVLPATLASVPFGKQGFAELEDKMPDHISMISILRKQAGYQSNFVYGGDAEFDKMDVFLNRQGIDKIIDITKFDDSYSKLPENTNGFTWGFGDKEIFRRYIQEIKSENSKPRMDVILTIAMHDPFSIPNPDYYAHQFTDRLTELKLDENIKTFNLSFIKQFASILYFDESIEYFFSEMRKLPSFENTIFVITGDHRMPEIPISTQIDRFHVPLIIYSPMLKKSEKFSSVVTHFDLTPSLIALLNSNNIIKRPAVASWIGHGLDNSVAFRSRNTYPLMRNKNEILDLIDAENFYAAKTLYNIYPSLDIEPVEESDRFNQLKDELDNFIRMNNYACQNNKLIPDSLIKWTGPGL